MPKLDGYHIFLTILTALVVLGFVLSPVKVSLLVGWGLLVAAVFAGVEQLWARRHERSAEPYLKRQPAAGEVATTSRA